MYIDEIRKVKDLMFRIDENYRRYATIINEDRYILMESQESKSIAAAKKLVMQRLNYSSEQADNFVRVELRNKMHSLSTKDGGKFILGATRLWLDGELDDDTIKEKLNTVIELISDERHINMFDRNLNGLSAEELINLFSDTIENADAKDVEEVNKIVFQGDSRYTVVRIDTFEEASDYQEYTSWCVTQNKNMFTTYTSNGLCQFYFCLRDDFKTVEAVNGKNHPLDEYGLSMVSVLVNEKGRIKESTCRWNNPGKIMNEKQISLLINKNFYQVFKPNNKWQKILDDATQKLKSGVPMDEIFDVAEPYINDLYYVELQRRCNFMNKKREFLSDTWFDAIYEFLDGFAMVRLGNEYNFIDDNGKLLSEEWFDEVYTFHGEIAKVRQGNRYNFINFEGKLTCENGFDKIDKCLEGFTRVQNNWKYNFVNKSGKIISDEWFDMAEYFVEGFSLVELQGKWKFINGDGQVISDTYDYAEPFKNGMAVVYNNEKYNIIDSNCKEILKQWYDRIYQLTKDLLEVMMGNKSNLIDLSRGNTPFLKVWCDSIMYDTGTYNDYGVISVRSNNKYNYVNEVGKPISEMWFDWAPDFFSYGVASVRNEGKWNLMRPDGTFLSEEWFDKVGAFYHNTTNVQLGKKYNLIKSNGKFVSGEWFVSLTRQANAWVGETADGRLHYYDDYGDSFFKKYGYIPNETF